MGIPIREDTDLKILYELRLASRQGRGCGEQKEKPHWQGNVVNRTLSFQI